jgi:hypothetical protein
MKSRIPLQVAFLTGQSDPRSCALSPVQASFLERLRLPPGVACPFNFPYRTGLRDYAPTPILQASVHNARQYVRSRRAEFISIHQPDVTRLLSQAEHTLLLAGSCGLELLVNLHLPADWLSRLSVFAYGPVSRARPGCRGVLVQGRSDWLSRRYFTQVDHIVACGHLDYLDSPEVLQLCRKMVNETRHRLERVDAP